MARVGEERHALHRHIGAEHAARMRLDRAMMRSTPGLRHERRGKQHATDIDVIPDIFPRRNNTRAERRLDFGRCLLRNDSSIETEDDLIWHHIGVIPPRTRPTLSVAVDMPGTRDFTRAIRSARLA